jgi:hypothetical protein
MTKQQTIGMRIYGIVVKLVCEGHSTVESDLKKISLEMESATQADRWNAAVDALHAVILEHAKQGVDILSREYRQGVVDAVKSLQMMHISL